MGWVDRDGGDKNDGQVEYKRLRGLEAMTLVAVSNTSNGGDHDDDGGRQQLQVKAEMVIYLFVCCLWLEQGHGGLDSGLLG